MTDIYKPRFMNGGEIRQGDVGGSTNPTRPEGGLEPKIHGTSPTHPWEERDRESLPIVTMMSCGTHTREELVEVAEMALVDVADEKGIGYAESLRSEIIIDALIAIGAVRVK